MFTRVSTLSLLAVAGCVLLGAARLGAQLAEKSPFMPVQSASAPGPTAGAPLEFRGYMETGEGTQYRLYDPARKLGAWVKLNERSAELEVVVKQHNDKMLTVEHQGRPLTLALREPKIVSSGSPAQAMPMPVPPPAAAVQGNVAPAVTQAVVLNPSPADEQRRLEAVAAEVARRRALREQATQQIGQGGPPAVMLPQMPAPPPGAPLPGGGSPVPNAQPR